MKFEHLANMFLNWGYYIVPEEYEGFRYYLQEMLRRNRVIVIRDDLSVIAIVTFFLTNDYSKLYKKSMWYVPDDEPDGKQIYIDKMVCRQWIPSIRHKLQEAIETQFPHVEEAYYHRGPYDRCVKIRRKGVLSCNTK